MQTTIHREADRVWLKGVSGWSLHERPSSVHAAQAAVMQAVGEDLTYDYLLGVSGLAFRMQVSKKTLCPSSPHAFCGYPCVARSRESLPWQLQVIEMKPEQKESTQAARQAVVNSIERRVPVQYGNEEDGIIIGYQRKGEEWICLHPLRDRGQKPFVTSEWPWGVAVFGERKPHLATRRELAIGAMEQAVKMARTDEAEAYYLRFRAWDDYIVRLNAMDTADDNTKSEALLGNAWIYQCLTSYRASAAYYLREVACDFESPVAAHLSHAAHLYERIAGEVLSDKEHMPPRIAPFPGGPDDGKFWTAEMRREQVRRLEAALPLEREAIGEIEVALYQITSGAEFRKNK